TGGDRMSTLLRDLLEERSTPAPSTAYRARLSDVHERIGRARRRRVVAAAGAVAAVLVAVAALTVGGGGGWTAPPPQVATTPDFPPNEFRGGVLAATSVRLPQRTGSLTFTAESLDLMI